jgi:hypothetical protein
MWAGAKLILKNGVPDICFKKSTAGPHKKFLNPTFFLLIVEGYSGMARDHSPLIHEQEIRHCSREERTQKNDECHGE